MNPKHRLVVLDRIQIFNAFVHVRCHEQVRCVARAERCGAPFVKPPPQPPHCFSMEQVLGNTTQVDPSKEFQLSSKHVILDAQASKC